MISKILIHLKRLYRKATGSLAFWPSILSICFLLFGILLLGLPADLLAIATLDKWLGLGISAPETARTLLSVLTGGLISLMVFSFSMVMIVLNQATAQFSPRLLPGLISDRYHQVILGVYLGTIIYNLTVLVQIMPHKESGTIPSIAILLSIFFGVASLGLFVIFIHSISNAVRIDNILYRLYGKTKEAMETHLVAEVPKDAVESENWNTIKSDRSGYLFHIDTKAMVQIAKDQGIQIHLLEPAGAFVFQNQPVMRLSQMPEDESLVEQLKNVLEFTFEENISVAYNYGFKQITEIAVKAMSPGINDPGTATTAIDYLTELLRQRLSKYEAIHLKDEEETVRLQLQPFPVANLLHEMLAPMRCYFSADVIVYERAVQMVVQLIQHDKIPENHRDLLQLELQKMWDDAQDSLRNKSDRERIRRLVAEIVDVKSKQE